MSLLAPASRAARRPAPWLRLVGPAVAVSIGYIDPGNWASDIGAGAYGFSLLWVLLVANAVAMVLQLAVSRLTVAGGIDLAGAIAARWPRWKTPAWALFQSAVMATDVAEFTGIVLGSQLLFGLSTGWSVGFGLLVVAGILFVNQRGVRALDAATIAALVAVTFVSLRLVAVLRPDPAAIARGALLPTIPDGGALLVVAAIIGATVMPHNLFLHSTLIADRLRTVPAASTHGAARFFERETIVALNVAAIVNASILIVGASLHGRPTTIGDAFAALHPGGAIDGAFLFGAALLISGIAASTTATFSGDAICGSLSPIRLSLGLRRSLAVLPAAALLCARVGSTQLLLWSQTFLCLVLPVVVVPVLALLYRKGAPLVRQPRFFYVCGSAALLCTALDLVVLVQSV